jgi:cardiolipin synthase A/B
VTGGTDAFVRFAELALALVDSSGLECVCRALEAGQLSLASTAATRAAVAQGSATVVRHLRSLQEIWTGFAADVSPQMLALMLRASASSVAVFRHQVPSTEVAWTGPKVEGSFLRATREVVRELLRHVHAELLVVGYWIAARDDGEGFIDEVIVSLAEAVARGVTVTVVVDERVRPDGKDNRGILMAAWPKGVIPPKILTWRLPPTDKHLKLHAKVLVADRRDALVTSANLTSYAMDRNMEMGVRIMGHPAGGIAKHFDLLEAAGVLEPYGEDRGPL